MSLDKWDARAWEANVQDVCGASITETTICQRDVSDDWHGGAFADNRNAIPAVTARRRRTISFTEGAATPNSFASL